MGALRAAQRTAEQQKRPRRDAGAFVFSTLCQRQIAQRFLTISSVTFLASPNSIMVLSRKNSSFSTPA